MQSRTTVEALHELIAILWHTKQSMTTGRALEATRISYDYTSLTFSIETGIVRASTTTAFQSIFANNEMIAGSQILCETTLDTLARTNLLLSSYATHYRGDRQ